MDRLQKNIKIFYITNFLQACLLIVPIWAFFFTSYLNFSFWTALFLVVLSWLVSFLFEVPSGAWADRFWRKKLFLIWILLTISAFTIWLFAKDLVLFIISSILEWIWFAILSWNFEAIIHDNLEEVWDEIEFKNITANSYIAIFLGRAFSSLFAWFLFVLDPLYPIYATIIAYVFVFILALFIKESAQILSTHSDNISHIKEALNYLRKHKILFFVILILSIESWLGNIYWFTYQPFLDKLWFSIENIWIIFAIIGVFSAIGSHIIKKVQDKFTESIIIYFMLFILLFVSLLFISFDNIPWVIWIIILSIIFGFTMPFWNNFLIQKSPKTHKSTILSIFSFWITIWYVSFAIPAWFLVDYIWIEKVYLLNIFLIIWLIVFSFLSLRKI